ncbi:MAG: S-adenosylmethionine decarboxylase [Candidatus Pacebacteria bacterium]|nr:S-adenosylmethionine decarboxylase [Candidatus Paceibacterota bacterium]MDR3583155.1 S-adenosylmethionine decarboxylase [Candidatus Paceibacterota bacterium]
MFYQKKLAVAVEEKTINFGLHLTLDGYGGNPDKLNDGRLVKKCLDELPEKVNMHKIFGPEVLEAGPANPKDSGGWSGFVMIAESHISCHTFPWRKFVSVDVYTCGSTMDKDFIVNYFTEAFELQDVEINFIQRGTRFPAKDIVCG